MSDTGRDGTGFPDIPDASAGTDSADDPELQHAVQQIMDGLQSWNEQPAQDAALETPDWAQMPLDQLAQESALDPHNDGEALGAMLPEKPPPAWFHDSSHPQHLSRGAVLMRLLASAASGGLAGAGSRTVGEGFQYGLQAARNLQDLAARRQAAKDQADWRQAQIQRAQVQTAGLPQAQADLSAQRQARARLIDAQAEKLKRGPNDRLLHSYNAADGRVHFVFQKADGTDTYEKTSAENFYQKPAPPEKPPRPLLAHGPDGVYLINPDTAHARKVIDYPPHQVPRRASPEYFRKVDNWKAREWDKVANDSSLSDEQRLEGLQQVQDHYERAIVTGGGDVAHYDVRIDANPGTPASQDPRDPLGIR